jgi:hypothetical protein
MVTKSPSAALVPVAPMFSTAERLALAGFLAGYSGLTRQAYELDLRQYANWCRTRHLHLFDARRADIECFARDLEARGRARATITRRLCTIAGLYRYAVEEELLDHSPAVHVRRPRLDYASLSPAVPFTRRLGLTGRAQHRRHCVQSARHERIVGPLASLVAGEGTHVPSRLNPRPSLSRRS